MPDISTIVALLMASSTLIWLGYDRFHQAQRVGSETAQNLAIAAETLVKVAQEIYTQQIVELKLEVAELKIRVRDLERELRRPNPDPANVDVEV